jgi:hypothetical protein
MIIYPPALVLSVSTPLTKPRIGWQTHTRTAVIGDVTVSTEAADGPRDAPLRPDTFEYWLPTAMPATWTINLGAMKDVDYVGIASHQCGSLGVTVRIDTSPDGTVWTQFASNVLPSDDGPLLFLDALRSVRFVKLTLTGATSPRIAAIYTGVILAMAKAVTGGFKPIPLARQSTLKQSMSRGGQFLGQSFQRNGIATDANFTQLPAAWVRQYFDPFSKSARLYPYFFAWNPQQAPLEVGYVWTRSDIVPAYSGNLDLMDVRWPMEGIGLAT